MVVGKLYPEMVDETLDEDNEPSCCAMEALERQRPFVNTALAQHALALVARLLRYGEITYHGAFVDAAAARAVPLPVNPELWRRVRRRGARPKSTAGPEQHKAG